MEPGFPHHVDEQVDQQRRAPMKLNMIVVMTMWLPRLAWR
jgi:hypothetical protein